MGLVLDGARAPDQGHRAAAPDPNDSHLWAIYHRDFPALVTTVHHLTPAFDDGAIVPTFPNARYLFGASEWDYWKDAPDPYGTNALDHALKPVFAAGLVDLVQTDHRICDEIRLIPTPGHTPGHVSVLINSNGEEAVITGDMFHHPLQMANPGWIDMGDHESELAERTRIAFMERFGNRPSLVLGTHFATPTAGKIVGARGGFRFIS